VESARGLILGEAGREEWCAHLIERVMERVSVGGNEELFGGHCLC
jgi:hypothetical protein